ncbi:MAG: 2-(1,2-epoxy-1,2-dihydrophenyl)acetyl-CoA isomerase PaaG [Rhizobiaceae bacterium]|nr:2-(1,2-epoxy-1,2-dihydrophenyl)acetyl-CoA isomerase PaaG [Rhizobiaceae bacterium]
MSVADCIIVENSGGGVTITLNRPDQLNAFNEAQHLAFRQALEVARDDEGIRAILITGAGRGFCAGQDLGDRDPSKMDGPPDLGETIENFYNPLIRLIRSIPKPVICAVNGVAAGAGANIALACDIVLAAKSAKFIQAFCRLGLVADSGGSWILPRLVGEARARALIMSGAPVLAEQAQQWGMIWRAVDDDQMMNEAKELLQHFSSAPTFGLGLMKQALNASSDNSLDQQLDLERDLQRRAGRSADYAEGVAAFLQKRKPEYSGRE